MDKNTSKYYEMDEKAEYTIRTQNIKDSES
jgi:hypothetical protein